MDVRLVVNDGNLLILILFVVFWVWMEFFVMFLEVVVLIKLEIFVDVIIKKGLEVVDIIVGK